jgi:hypothetical protein
MIFYVAATGYGDTRARLKPEPRLSLRKKVATEPSPGPWISTSNFNDSTIPVVFLDCCSFEHTEVTSLDFCSALAPGFRFFSGF